MILSFSFRITYTKSHFSGFQQKFFWLYLCHYQYFLRVSFTSCDYGHFTGVGIIARNQSDCNFYDNGILNYSVFLNSNKEFQIFMQNYQIDFKININDKIIQMNCHVSTSTNSAFTACKVTTIEPCISSEHAKTYLMAHNICVEVSIEFKNLTLVSLV